GMLMAYGIYFGDRAMLFMMIFPMKAKHFVWILGGIELMSTLFSGRNGAASIAHLGGMIAGFGFLWGRTMMILAKKRHQEGGGFLPKKKKSSHLKLISGKASSSDDDDKPKPTTWH
ncbi:MAG: rhomboid family intramembrane serine protease, partial [Bdellovibrionota bacterium]